MSDDQEREIVWIKAPANIVDLYANNFHLTWTKDDVRIRLAAVVPSPNTPNPGPDFRGVSEERAAVTFAWRMAKVLLESLSRAIDGYEQVNGEIKLDVVLPASTP